MKHDIKEPIALLNELADEFTNRREGNALRFKQDKYFVEFIEHIDGSKELILSEAFDKLIRSNVSPGIVYDKVTSYERNNQYFTITIRYDI